MDNPRNSPAGSSSTLMSFRYRFSSTNLKPENMPPSSASVALP